MVALWYVRWSYPVYTVRYCKIFISWCISCPSPVSVRCICLTLDNCACHAFEFDDVDKRQMETENGQRTCVECNALNRTVTRARLQGAFDELVEAKFGVDLAHTFLGYDLVRPSYIKYCMLYGGAYVFGSARVYFVLFHVATFNVMLLFFFLVFNLIVDLAAASQTFIT